MQTNVTLVALDLCGLLAVLQIEDGLTCGIGELEGESRGTRAMRAQNRGDVGRRIWEEDPGPWCGRRTQETQRGGEEGWCGRTVGSYHIYGYGYGYSAQGAPGAYGGYGAPQAYGSPGVLASPSPYGAPAGLSYAQQQPQAYGYQAQATPPVQYQQPTGYQVS